MIFLFVHRVASARAVSQEVLGFHNDRTRGDHARPDGTVFSMTERSAGWRQGPDGQWYPPVNAVDGEGSVATDQERLTELGVLVNSGALTSEIDEVVKDPELAV